MHAAAGAPSSSRLIQAQPPHTSHRTGVRSRSSGWRLCSENAPAWVTLRVPAVGPVAPAVEGADEPAAAGAPALGDPDAAVPADVVERPHAEVLGAHDDDRLVEDLVLGEVTRLGYLLQPARHLPDPRPEQLGLQPVEVRVVVALLAHPVRHLDRVGHREGPTTCVSTIVMLLVVPPGVPVELGVRLTGRYNLPTVRLPEVSPRSTRRRQGSHLHEHLPLRTSRRPTVDRRCVDVLVVGAGITGIYQLYRAREEGFSVLLLEAGDGVGGTWYWNRYPGARFDSESYTYGYLFSKELFDEWEWQEHFAPQPETERYLNHVVDRFDLRRHMRFGARVDSAEYDEESGTWRVAAGDGTEVQARFLIAATGVLSVPYTPDVPGRDDFRASRTTRVCGRRTPVDFAGKRVAVVGTSSSGVQVVPAIADEVASLTVYQRTANWCTPLNNAPDHRRGAGPSCGPASSSCARSSTPRCTASTTRPRPRPPSTTRRTSADASTRRCGTAPASRS